MTALGLQVGFSLEEASLRNCLFPRLLDETTDKPMTNIRYLDQEIINLKKDLKRSRHLIKSVKIGRSYFTMLKEEIAMKKQQQLLAKLKEEELHRFQPARRTSDLPYGHLLLGAYFDEKTKTVKGSIPRPFTPMYSCLVSPFLPESHVEALFRQLCALHWLLEALTIDHTHHTMKPVITCWNLRDPGGSKSTVKKINKDKSMGQKWENFITAPKTKKFKLPGIRTTSRKPSRRGSMISLSRTSMGSSPQSSMVSVNPPGSDDHPSVIVQAKDMEDNESSSTKAEEENLHYNLQKLLELVREDAHRCVMIEAESLKKVPSITAMLRQTKSDSINKDMQTSTVKSSDRSISTSADSHSLLSQRKGKSRIHDITQSKSGVCNMLRAKFFSVAQEAGFCLQDKMEVFMKRQEERGIQKFQSFVVVSNFQKDLGKMRRRAPMLKGDAQEIADHWYFDLLTKLPEDLKNFLPAKKILVKLQKFGENLDLRIRPHVLLKVLQDLRVWELCSPDIAVAIEFVREHIIHMPQEDYISWLQNKINMPIRIYDPRAEKS
ncbi:coiled-coil domain-containing protein 60 [Sorex fumeus]|uniref:coiled-coil domain-containing protein 60 n=1 Tax=Sorex fumeus TaxID=62283 RepID=UPI0024AE15B7|nr:coiled-coil domain-containing protein 60 [Sorex fumeus]